MYKLFNTDTIILPFQKDYRNIISIINWLKHLSVDVEIVNRRNFVLRYRVLVAVVIEQGRKYGDRSRQSLKYVRYSAPFSLGSSGVRHRKLKEAAIHYIIPLICSLFQVNFHWFMYTRELEGFPPLRNVEEQMFNVTKKKRVNKRKYVVYRGLFHLVMGQMSRALRRLSFHILIFVEIFIYIDCVPIKFENKIIKKPQH